MPPISTSSPGSKPSRSSAAITPRRVQAPLDVRLGLLVLEVEARDQALDGVAGDAEVALAGCARPRSRGRRAAGRPRYSATSSSPAGLGRVAGLGRHRRKQHPPQLVEALRASRWRSRAPGRRRPAAHATRCRRRSASAGGYEVGLGQREDARQRGERGSCAPSSASIIAWLSTGSDCRRAARGRARARARGSARRGRGSRGRGPAPSLAPSISPGMSAMTSWRSSASSVPSIGSSVVNG